MSTAPLMSGDKGGGSSICPFVSGHPDEGTQIKYRTWGSWHQYEDSPQNGAAGSTQHRLHENVPDSN